MTKTNSILGNPVYSLSHKAIYILSLPARDRVDFLPLIQTRQDHKILESWRNFFMDKNVPFLVTKEHVDAENPIYRLYKRKEAS